MAIWVLIKTNLRIEKYKVTLDNRDQVVSAIDIDTKIDNLQQRFINLFYYYLNIIYNEDSTDVEIELYRWTKID
jgi:hypothetical protein